MSFPRGAQEDDDDDESSADMDEDIEEEFVSPFALKCLLIIIIVANRLCRHASIRFLTAP